MRPILIYGHPCLRQTAAPVDAVDAAVAALANDMIEAMYAAPGRGLAAPQIGESLRLFVVDAYWKDGAPRLPQVYVNPKITWRSEAVATVEEGCLSIPDVPVDVTRPARVCLDWTDLGGQRRTCIFAGIEAVCVQHELDHLDGVMIPDHASDATRAAIEPALQALAAQAHGV